MDTKEKIRQYERGFRAGQKEQLEKIKKKYYHLSMIRKIIDKELEEHTTKIYTLRENGKIIYR